LSIVIKSNYVIKICLLDLLKQHYDTCTILHLGYKSLLVKYIYRRFAMSKLNLLGAWNGGLEKFFAGNSARSFMKTGLTAMAAGGSCGPSCGAGDGDKKKEEPKPKPEGPACGASCGAGDDGKKKEQPKPSACGSDRKSVV
jgi:hypothetical protein